jgi:hypothetical protein
MAMDNNLEKTVICNIDAHKSIHIKFLMQNEEWVATVSQEMMDDISTLYPALVDTAPKTDQP